MPKHILVIKISAEKTKVRSFRKHASVFKVLSDENRLAILQVLVNGAKPVNEIAAQLDISQPLVSHHLKTLKNAGLVVSCRKKAFVYHALVTPKIIEMINDTKSLGEEITQLSEDIPFEDENSFFKNFPVCFVQK